MVVQTQAARRVAGRDMAAAASALQSVSSCGRDALVDMRRMIGVLHRGDVELAGPGLALLPSTPWNEPKHPGYEVALQVTRGAAVAATVGRPGRVSARPGGPDERRSSTQAPPACAITVVHTSGAVELDILRRRVRAAGDRAGRRSCRRSRADRHARAACPVRRRAARPRSDRRRVPGHRADPDRRGWSAREGARPPALRRAGRSRTRGRLAGHLRGGRDRLGRQRRWARTGGGGRRGSPYGCRLPGGDGCPSRSRAAACRRWWHSQRLLPGFDSLGVADVRARHPAVRRCRVRAPAPGAGRASSSASSGRSPSTCCGPLARARWCSAQASWVPRGRSGVRCARGGSWPVSCT